jgi:hypothetical protein
MDTEKLWLNSLSWEEVQQINQSLCQKQNTQFQTNEKTHGKAREIWQKAAAQPLS